MNYTKIPTLQKELVISYLSNINDILHTELYTEEEGQCNINSTALWPCSSDSIDFMQY